MFSNPKNLLVGISGASGNESKPLSKQKMCFEKMLWGISEMVNARASKSLPLFTSGNFWGSRNEIKVLSMLKHVLRKCCGLSQKWWMLKLPSLCHCVQHPWKLTSRNFWGSRNESMALSKQKHVFSENAVGLYQKRWRLELPNLCHCLLVGISGALGMKLSHFLC